jgi:UDP-N-acetylglucosamine acyltransferase
MAGPEIFVHSTAVVHPGARLDAGAWIGPFCVVGAEVSVGRNTRLESHVSLLGATEIGAECRFAPFVSVGTDPQDIGCKGDPTRVKIGDGNVFKEFVTVNRATVKGGGLTLIGDRNYLMAYTHIAHDNRIGSDVIFTNAATLGGHVEVGDFAVLGGFTGVHQFCRIGRFAFTGGFTVITQDVPPFLKVAGMRPPRIFGLNAIGLRRRGFARERIDALRRMIRILCFSNLNTTQAVSRIEAEFPVGPDRDELLEFVRTSKRGVLKKTAGSWDESSEF